MPEQPEPVTTADLDHMIGKLAETFRVSLSNGWSELAAATAAGRNVRDLPSDEISTFTGTSIEGPTQIILPADETRTRVTLIAAAAGVWIAAKPGVMPGSYSTFELPVDVPVVLETRAPIYAGSFAAAGQVAVGIVAEAAHYRL